LIVVAAERAVAAATPTADSAVFEQGAVVLGSGGDLEGRRAELDGLARRELVFDARDAEGALGAVAPAVDGASLKKGAGVDLAGDDLQRGAGERQRAQARGGLLDTDIIILVAVAGLAELVVAPTADSAADEQGAGVVASGGDLERGAAEHDRRELCEQIEVVAEGDGGGLSESGDPVDPKTPAADGPVAKASAGGRGAGDDLDDRLIARERDVLRRELAGLVAEVGGAAAAELSLAVSTPAADVALAEGAKMPGGRARADRDGDLLTGVGAAVVVVEVGVVAALRARGDEAVAAEVGVAGAEAAVVVVEVGVVALFVGVADAVAAGRAGAEALVAAEALAEEVEGRVAVAVVGAGLAEQAIAGETGDSAAREQEHEQARRDGDHVLWTRGGAGRERLRGRRGLRRCGGPSILNASGDEATQAIAQLAEAV
jgi:hypothetical protein